MKLEGTFSTDEYLMYLIQEVTKLPTSDLLGFFSDLGKKMAEMGAEYMEKEGTRSMRKSVFDFFPGTSIPFNMRVNGWRAYSKDPDVIHYSIEVAFPESRSMVDQKILDDIIIEKELLGGADMAQFKRPEPKCNKMYKKLMQEIRDKRFETKD